MFSEKYYPPEVKGQDLDNYLSRGWYRMGQSIFTTHFLCFGSQFYSALWIRLPLQDYKLSKSLRKLHNKNQKHFRVQYQPSIINDEKEALYQKYRKNFPAPLSPSLKESLLDLEDHNIFDTYEAAVYDKDNKLVACSFFDIGKESTASILGIYDSDYANFSLGLYTMVLEILFSIKNGFKYYYPGYVVPGYTRFDYKLRIGDVFYYHLKSDNWIPFDEKARTNTPLLEMESQLEAVRERIAHFGIKGILKYYPMFEANLVSFSLTTYFDFPVLLQIKLNHLDDQEQTDFFIVVYNTRSGFFQLIHCLPFDSPFFYFKAEFVQSFNENKDKFLLRLITVADVLLETKNTNRLVIGIQELAHRKNKL